RVTFEKNTEEIERLALEPIRGGPHIDDRVDDGRLLAFAPATQRQTHVVDDREELIRDAEARSIVRFRLRTRALDSTAEAGGRGIGRRPLVAAIRQIVDAREIDELRELELRAVAQFRRDADELVRAYVEDHVLRQRRRLAQPLAEVRRDLRGHCLYR